jgi:hypothetical protein
MRKARPAAYASGDVKMPSMQMTTGAYLRGVNPEQINTLCSRGGALTKAADVAAQRLKRSFPSMLLHKDSIRHDIMLVFLKKAHLFSPARANLNTFIDRVVRSVAMTLYRKYERQRSSVQTFTDARFVESSHVGREDCTRATVEISDLRSKVRGFLQSLDRNSKTMCKVLQEEKTDASRARKLGLSRWGFKRDFEKIKSRFQEAGFHHFFDRR